MGAGRISTYPSERSAPAVHDEAVGLVRADLEGYAAGLDGVPRRQDLKQRKAPGLLLGI